MLFGAASCVACAEASASSSTQLWEPLLSRAQGLSNSGKCEKACCLSGLLLLLFLFLLPWYPWRPHEQRACFQMDCGALAASPAHQDKGALLGIAHTLRNSAASRPDVQTSECVFIPASTLLFQAGVQQQHPCSVHAVLYVCVCVSACMQAEREGGVVTDTALSLSVRVIFALCCTFSDRCHADVEKRFSRHGCLFVPVHSTANQN